jgi:ribosomal protein S18 acetylase RimI-like enzyme
MTRFLYRAEMLFRRVIPEGVFSFRSQSIGKMPIKPLLEQPAVESAVFQQARFDENDRQLLAAQAGIEAVENRIRHNNQAWFADDTYGLLAACWTATGEYFDLDTGTTVVLRPNEAWLFGAWVRKDARGRGIYRQLLQHVGAALSQEGVSTFLLGVDHSNRLSSRVHERLGTVWIGRCSGVRIMQSGRYRIHIDERQRG